MTIGLAAIDHLMVSVQDSQKAGDLFERMGFTATPRSLMPGLSNRLICFPAQQPDACNYIELMALEDAALAPPPLPKILPPAGRPVSMVLVSPEIDATYAALCEKGVRAPAPIHLQRDWELPGGEVITPKFAVLIPEAGQSPYFWNVCLHKTPEHYFRSEFVSHDNGARGLSAVIAVASDPVAMAEHYKAVWDAEIVGSAPVCVRIGAVDLRIYSPAELEAAFPALAPVGDTDRLVGFAISCSDTDKTAEYLQGNGFSPLPAGDSFYVAPAETDGNLVVFEPTDD